MEYEKQLPDAEFEVMRAVWSMEEPVTSSMVAARLAITMKDKTWRSQTVVTLLNRLEKKGFLESCKVGKEREYTSRIREESYMSYEAERFVSKFQNGSAAGLVKALYRENRLDESDIAELRQWLEDK